MFIVTLIRNVDDTIDRRSSGMETATAKNLSGESRVNVERRSLTLGVAVKLALFPMIGLAKILTVKIKEY